MAGPLIILDKVFMPISLILLKLSEILKRGTHDSPLSKDELSDAISIASGKNIQDEKILKGIINFGNIDAREIMKPRIDIMAIDIKTPL